MIINITAIILLLALIILIFLVKRTAEKTTIMYKTFSVLIWMFIIHITGLFFQIVFLKSSIPPIYFEYIAYIGGMNFSTATFIVACVYFNEKIDVKKLNLLYVIPFALLIILWTNDIHHLFYREYSIYLSKSEFGPALDFFTVYSYVLLTISFIMMLMASIKRSGFISKQTAIMVLGLLFPTVANFLGIIFPNLNLSVYVTPILFTITAVCLYISIFKLKALNVIPIATKTIVDTMTDAFMVLSKDGTIADINKTCIDKFAPLAELKENDNLFEKLEGKKTVKLETVQEVIAEVERKNETVTKEYHIKKNEYDKYFEIDFQPIKAKRGDEYVATLLLIRDTTQAKKDIEIITKNENLVILGEIAGGVAHDINTPISAIKSGITMLKSTNKNDDEKMLLDSMDRCADKIIALVNSLRNQIRNIGGDTVTDISIANVLNDIKIILNNELKKNNVELAITVNSDVHLKGNPTKLSQVFTNIITNAVQAYEKKGGKVNVVVDRSDSHAVITFRDYASGIPESVRPYIFKNILTTKGVSGTGFGLYLAYSIIKGAFGGDISFETETGKGTTFKITIPIK